MFLELYEPVMKSKGFHRKRHIFHRLVNNKIVQMLSYCMFSGRREFTIQYDYVPLCSGDDFEFFMDAHRIGSLMGKESYGDRDPNNPDHIRETLELCQEYIFPFFDRMVDYESLYDYEIKRHEIMLSESSEAYKKAHSELLKAPMTSSFLAVSIATGHYDMAQKSREAVIYQNEDALSAFIEFIDRTRQSPCPEFIREREERIALKKEELALLKKAVDTNDKAFFEEYIHAKEKCALENYIRNYYGKRAFDLYKNSGKLPFELTE